MLNNRRITNGLAWAGLCLVVGVPTADFVSGQLMGEPQEASVAVLTPAVTEASIIAPIPAPLSQRPAPPKPVETAVAKPAEPAKAPMPAPAPAEEEVASAGDVVDDFLATGRSLPSYITDAASPSKPAAVAATPQPVVSAPVTAKPVATPSQTAAAPSPISPLPSSPAQPEPAQTDPVEVASIGPQKVAPVPMPLSMRPKPVEPVLVPQTAAAGEAIVIPGDIARPNDQRITEDELADWEYGPLDDFLARRQGRDVEADAGSSASVTYGNGAVYPPAYVRRQPRRDIYVGPIEEEFFFPFLN